MLDYLSVYRLILPWKQQMKIELIANAKVSRGFDKRFGDRLTRYPSAEGVN